jgi:hypothetical protein
VSMAVDNTLRQTKMALSDEFKEGPMSGYKAVCGRSVVASESRMIGKRMRSSSMEARFSSEVDASFCAEARQRMD